MIRSRTHRLRQGYPLSLSLAAFGPLLLAGCSGPQSALAPAGRESHQLATLFWWMLTGSAVICAGMVALTWVAVRSQPEARWAQTYIIGGGVVLPVAVLTGLLIFGLAQLPQLLAPAPEGSLRITVSGEQWWWRIHYRPPGEEAVELANEIRLPVGEPVQFELVSPDVIHAFWIPSLGGKIDMIPGRQNRLTLHPTQTGTFRGVCAEYCGTSHALMAFPVVVMEREAFAAWLEDQRRPAVPNTEATEADELIVRGQHLFQTTGCGACHTIRGTEADGEVGPDLTHVGSRLSLGAGVLGNEREDFIRWIASTDQVKPGVLMPHFGMLPPDELEAVAAYLDSLP